MNQNHNDKFEADMRQVEQILDRAKADLMNLLPEIESLRTELRLEPGDGSETAAAHASNTAGDGNVFTAGRNHSGWFRFFSHKS